MRSPLLLALALLLAAPVLADRRAGVDAFNDGRYLEALEELKPLAEQGDMEAQYRIGLIFLKGLGIPPNSRRGLEMMERAAEAGQKQAALDLSAMYEKGEDLPKDAEQAKRWADLAAKIEEQRQNSGSGGGDCQ